MDKKDAVATGLCQKPNRTRYAGLRFGSEEQQSECAISFVMKRKNSSQAIRRLRRVVRLKGFEPPTFWFVAKHSIQLSYWRIPQFRLPVYNIISRPGSQGLFSKIRIFFETRLYALSSCHHALPTCFRAEARIK